MKKLQTQIVRVFEYLDSGKTINQSKATKQLGVSRLSAHICQLKKEGVTIYDKDVRVKNRFDEFTYIREYSLCPF